MLGYMQLDVPTLLGFDHGKLPMFPERGIQKEIPLCLGFTFGISPPVFARL